MSNIAREGKAPTHTCMRAPNKASEPALPKIQHGFRDMYDVAIHWLRRLPCSSTATSSHGLILGYAAAHVLEAVSKANPDVKTAYGN